MDLVCGGGPASLNGLSGLLFPNIVVSEFPEEFGTVFTIANLCLLPLDTRAATTGCE